MRVPFHGVVLLIVLGFIASCATVENGSSHLTPTMLRAHSSEFDGKVVTVVAWITLESENANLWTSAEDMESSRSIHCVSLENFDQFWEQRNRLTRHRVKVTGTFRKDVVADSGTLRFAACSESAMEPTSVTIL